jgi:hypothetical protein
MKCPKEDSVGAVCGEDNQSYESECEMLKRVVKLAYKGLCKKNCQSEVCLFVFFTFWSLLQEEAKRKQTLVIEVKDTPTNRCVTNTHYTSKFSNQVKSNTTLILCQVCGIESRTYASRCHANEVNAHVDYYGHCEYHFKTALMKDNERGSFFEDERCEMVYENGRCSSVKCEATVLPPGACCPICGEYGEIMI